MINELKQLLSEVTVNITTDVNKVEISFSFNKETDDVPEVKKPAMSGKGKVTGSLTNKKESKEVDEIQPEDIEAAAEKLDEIVEEAKATIETKTEPVAESKPKEEERTPAQLERISKLTGLGFFEKKATKEFIRGGISVGSVMILGCTASEFQNHFIALKDNIDKANAEFSKSTKTFSDFKADEISFEEPVKEKELPKVDPKEAFEVEVTEAKIVEAPKPEAPKAMAPTPAVPDKYAFMKSLEGLELSDMINKLFKKFETEGYDISTLDAAHYPTTDSVSQMAKWLCENPIQKI